MFQVGSNCRRLQPGVYDIANPREKPLRVEVFAGNAGEPDPRIVDIDVVTAIELIEHMDESTHESLIINVFDVIQPKLAVFTTPNVEYNPLFPDGSVDKRRHWDHRFEWTRGQFQAWLVRIAGPGGTGPATLRKVGPLSYFNVSDKKNHYQREFAQQPHFFVWKNFFPTCCSCMTNLSSNLKNCTKKYKPDNGPVTNSTTRAESLV